MFRANANLSTVAILATTLLSLGGAGCSMGPLQRQATLPTGTQSPVNLRNFQIASAGGHRAVFLRMSRIPTMLRHTSSGGPAEIIIQAWGPEGTGDLPERALPQDDPLINEIRVSRESGALKVVLVLSTPEPPPHMVHEMADWVMIRFGAAPQS